MGTTERAMIFGELWRPTLREGAPSNAAGMRGWDWIYASRDAAERHEHWANQAPWATTARVTAVLYYDQVEKIADGVFVLRDHVDPMILHE